MQLIYLVIGREKDTDNLAFIAHETPKLEEANAKCRELNATDTKNSYKIETWTKLK